LELVDVNSRADVEDMASIIKDVSTLFNKFIHFFYIPILIMIKLISAKIIKKMKFLVILIKYR